jgi:hypothetical protein
MTAPREGPMRKTHVVALIALIAAVPAATAGSLLSSSGGKPCFIAGSAGYVLSGAKSDTESGVISVTHIVRIDNAAARPSLKMQVVDSPAHADFVLVDDSEAARTCSNATSIEAIRLDPAAARPELTVALSRKPADLKIYVRSAHYTEQDAAALFAVMWFKTNATGSIRSVAKNN